MKVRDLITLLQSKLDKFEADPVLKYNYGELFIQVDLFSKLDNDPKENFYYAGISSAGKDLCLVEGITHSNDLTISSFAKDYEE